MAAYIQIGSGRLYLRPVGGNEAANPTPIQGFTVQDVTLDVAGEIKELRGQYQFPDDTATTDKKLNGKFGIGRKDLTLFNQIFYADVISVTGQSVAPNVASTVPATGPFTITPTVPASGTFEEDLGVYYTGTGIELLNVATVSAAGQYQINASTGTYTFFSADASANVTISFSYTLTGHGATYQIHQQVIGWGPIIEVWIVDVYQPLVVSGANVYNTIRVYNAKVNKITIGNKRADYSIPEVDWLGYANAAGNVLDMYSVNG